MLPFFAALLPVMILFCGLSVDIGMLELKKVQMQKAADAGALGAQLEEERGTGNWVSMGQKDAGINGFTNGSNNVTVTVSNPALYGPYAGRYDAIQVTVSQKMKTYFYGALTGNQTTVMAFAVSLVTPCVYFTDLAGTSSTPLYLASAGYYSSCPVYVNKAIGVDGFAILQAYGESVAGPASASYVAGRLTYPPVYNVPVMADPLAYLTAPTFSGTCNYTSYSLTTGTATLSPGNYCQGMSLSNSTVTLQPGLYVITGGAKWSNETVNGSGVTLFFTTGGGTTSYGQFVLTNSNIKLSAPNDSSAGGIPTILIFGDRNWVKTSTCDFQLHGSNFYGDGVWYTTGTGISFQNSGSIYAPNYFAMDTDSTYVYANSLYPSNNFSNVPTGNPFRPLGGLVQ